MTNVKMGNLENIFVNQKMSANEIIQAYINMVFREKPQTKVFPNTYLGKWEGDIFELTKSGYLYEYEVKITRADFKADAKKESSYWHQSAETNWDRKHDTKYGILQDGKRVNYFYYIVPLNLITVEEVPEFAGLIYMDTTYVNPRFKVVKQAPKLSKEKATLQTIIKLLESCYYRFHTYRKQIIK